MVRPIHYQTRYHCLISGVPMHLVNDCGVRMMTLHGCHMFTRVVILCRHCLVILLCSQRRRCSGFSKHLPHCPVKGYPTTRGRGHYVKRGGENVRICSVFNHLASTRQTLLCNNREQKSKPRSPRGKVA